LKASSQRSQRGESLNCSCIEGEQPETMVSCRADGESQAGNGRKVVTLARGGQQSCSCRTGLVCWYQARERKSSLGKQQGHLMSCD